ncbi:MAG TPA: hypothetical protein VFD98_08425 [Terracidiphilus sp.]|jgi:hypothetical protein|nr:hypothetical protein [Terracidiphilus sp.]
MSYSPQNGYFSDGDPQQSADSGEDTLRLIASLPAPEGLADRVQAGLRNPPRAGRVLRWQTPLHPGDGWMRGGMVRSAAAAAIVCVVAGGGWTVYSRVLPASTAKITEMRPGVGANGGGFAPAGAKRVPETLQGPVLSHPVASPPDQPAVEIRPAESPQAAGQKKKKTAPKVATVPGP